MTKRISSTGGWEIHDLRRPGYNPQSNRLLPNDSTTEATTNHVDFLSKGFKIRNTYSGMNASLNDLYFFAAFAERPSGSMFGIDANAQE